MAVRLDEYHLLMIEPTRLPSGQPVVDDLTRRMTAAWRAHEPEAGIAYRGWHTCSCGRGSDNLDHHVGRYVTNSLCIHYLAWHRREVPESELEKVRALNSAGFEPIYDPNEDELRPPAYERNFNAEPAP